MLETLGADPQKIRTQVIRMVGESQDPVGAARGGGASGIQQDPDARGVRNNLTKQAEEGSWTRAWAAPSMTRVHPDSRDVVPRTTRA